MSSYIAFSDYNRLKRELNEIYGISVDSFELISDYCTSVYKLSTTNRKYIFKLHRTFDTEIALQSASIMDYLSKQSFPVVPVIHTKGGRLTHTMVFPQGNRTGMMLDYIDGQKGWNFKFDDYAVRIGEIMGVMHGLMEECDIPIIEYGFEHYVGRYIDIMKEFGYSPSRIEELEDFGKELWKNVAKTKHGFCHGDLNVSNFIVTPNNEYYIYDFDCGGISYRIKDIYCICCMTETIFDFNIEKIMNYIEINDKISLIRQGYEKQQGLNEYDIKAIYSFVGIGCYWSAGQSNKYRSLLEGNRRWLNGQYFDKRYDWLMMLKNIFKDKGIAY
jgi:Ser/Thr protein kinase RdoA (MazF antagonist)